MELERSTSTEWLNKQSRSIPHQHQNSSMETISSDQTLTPIEHISLQTSLAELDSRFSEPRSSPRSPRSPHNLSNSFLADSPTITFTNSGSTPGYLQEINNAGPSTASHQYHQITPSPLSFGWESIRRPNSAASQAKSLLTPTSPRSPPHNGMAGGFFSSFRPSSPKVNLQNQQATNNVGREDITRASSGRRGLERERDVSGSETSAKSRRPSSVFDHVGGMLDRFGRRLHSRGDSKEDRRILAASMIGLSENALDLGETGSSMDELSPNDSSTQMSPISALVPGWEAVNATDTASTSNAAVGKNGGSSAGLVWSPFLDDEARRVAQSPASLSDLQPNQSGVSSFNESNRLNTTPPVPSQSRRLSVMERTLIQVTEDNERFSVVDISGLNSAAAIKERMMSKLHLFEEDPTCFAVSRTEIGLIGAGQPQMNDDELLALCWQAGDDKGTLKFLLLQTTAPSQASHSFLPPPPTNNYSSPNIVPRDLNNSSNTNTSAPTSYSRPPHSQSGSISSRSSVGDLLGDSGSEASRAGGLTRVKARNRRAPRPGSISSVDRSPPHPSTPLLAAVAEQGRRASGGSGNNATSTANSTFVKPTRPERSEHRKGSQASDSPTEILRDLGEAGESAGDRSGIRRSGNTRPHSSHTSGRMSGHGQWESEVGTSSSRTNQGGRVPSSPLTSQAALLEKSASLSGTGEDHRAVQQLPKSLTPGGSQPRSLDAADAAHMYLGRASSPFDDTSRMPPPRDPAYQHNNVQYPQQSPGLGVHNVKSAEDMRRRSRPSIPSVSEMMSQQQQQQQQQHPHLPHQVHPVQPIVSARVQGRPTQQVAPAQNRLVNTDAHVGHQPPPLFNQQQGQGGNYDHRFDAPSQYAGMIARPRTSAGFERERSTSFGSAGLPYQSHVAMAPRLSGPGPGYEVVRPTTGGMRPVMMTAPGPSKPLMPAPNQVQPFDPRLAAASPRLGHYYNNEVGARNHMQGGPPPPPAALHHHAPDPRNMSTPHSISRPHTYHDQGRFRPPNSLPINQVRPQQIPPEDAYTRAHFPASSARTVTEFQRHPTGSLQPGMTVQETMQQQRHHIQQPHQQTAHSAGPLPRANDQWDPRSSSNRPQNRSYEHQMQPSPRMTPAVHHPGQQYQQHSQHSQQQGVSSNVNSSNYQPPSRQVPGSVVPLRTSNGSVKPTPQHRPHTAAVDGPPTERSSGSSFNTLSSTATSSHRRNVSSEDRNNTTWSEEAHSAPTSARSSRSESIVQESKGHGSAKPAAQHSSTMSKQISSPTKESELPYSYAYGEDGLLEEEDLINLRPLPKVPLRQQASQEVTSGKTSKGERKDEGESTLRAADWGRMLDSLGGETDDDGSGTLTKSGGKADLLSAKRSEANESESSGTSHATAVAESRHQEVLKKDALQAEEDGGTFKSFATFDDEEDEYDEGGTWAQPMDRLPTVVKGAGEPTAKDSKGASSSAEATLRPGASLPSLHPSSPRSNQQLSVASAAAAPTSPPRRPILTLNIEPLTHGSPLPTETISPKSIPAVQVARHLTPSLTPSLADLSPRLADISLALPSPMSSGVHRRTSFARTDVDWAFRPPPEQLYDNLDDFFPKHDLDKPVLDTNSALPGSPQTASPRAEGASSSQQLLNPNSPAPLSRNRFQHKKSIRIVAQDRKRYLERSEAAALGPKKVEGEGLNRRRSTKLWGGKVVEVTPGVEGAISSSSANGADSPLSDPSAKPVFKWVKGDLIGKGTYGRVYLALNATTGEMIAVKQVELPTTESDREDTRQKGVVSALKSEIETLKDLDHPNIVSYLGFEETTSYLSIFLEYVPGGSVGSCLRKHGKLDEDTIKSFLQQILAGLNYLHNRGILHRDLKADNLLVDFNGVVKISDFGTVRKSEDIYGNIASMSIQGSIFWMAPEVVSLSRAGYSAKVDIWSLGCVVLEMFAGRRPWSDEEAVQAMFKIGAERRAPPIPPDVRLSRAAAHFLKTCFAVDPNARPTAQRLLEHVFPHVAPGWQFADSSLYRALHR